MKDDSKVLFETNVGSHMWGMERPDSDVDVFRCYVVDTYDILRGNAKVDSYCIEDETNNQDISSHEIGKVIDYLIKGNVNFVWGVTSPIIMHDSSEFRTLRRIVLSNPCKNMFHSIHGLAIHNYRKHIEKDGIVNPRGYHKERFQKKMNTIFRSIVFGKLLLEEGMYTYTSVDINVTPNLIVEGIESLRKAFLNSELPDHPPEEEYREFLLNIRLAQLEE